MQIFWLDRDRKKSVEYTFDCHLASMMREGHLMLSTALWCCDPLIAENCYKNGIATLPTHWDHPLTKWTRSNFYNYNIVKLLLHHCQVEWMFRGFKKHISGLKAEKLPSPCNIDFSAYGGGLCLVPDKWNYGDLIENYRAYYINEKRHLAKWTGREKPFWWV